MQKCFSPGMEPDVLILDLSDQLLKLEVPGSGVSNPSTSTIFLTNFLAGLNSQLGDLGKAHEHAKRTLEDIQKYYGHVESTLAVDSMLIVIHYEFAQITDPAIVNVLSD